MQSSSFQVAGNQALLLLDSVASNVESTLAFTLSIKIVDIILDMQMQSRRKLLLLLMVKDGNESKRGVQITPAASYFSYDPVLMFSAGVLLFILVSGLSASLNDNTTKRKIKRKRQQCRDNSERQQQKDSEDEVGSIVRSNMTSIATHVLVLSFSRLALLQVTCISIFHLMRVAFTYTICFKRSLLCIYAGSFIWESACMDSNFIRLCLRV